MRRVVSPISLRKVYAQPGEYTVKMIIDPALSQGIESVSVEVRNSDGGRMAFAAKRWGTKLTVSFTIDATTPDGVSIIDLTLLRPRADAVRERLSFWVIK